MDIEVLSERVIFQKGSYKRVERWLRGIHPERGKIIRGLTGWETVEEADVICNHKFRVIDLTPSLVKFEEVTGDV